VGTTGPPTREVFAFAPYWQLPNNADWDYSLLSTVAYFGLDVNADGSFDQSGGNRGWQGWNSQELVEMINRAHVAGARVVVVIKAFDSGTINAIVTSAAATRRAIDGTIAAIAVRQLDGVNVDFEGSSTGFPDVQRGFTNFMTRLAAEVHARWPDAFVTADTYGGSASWDGGIFNISALGSVTDGLFVMAYDMGLSNDPGRALPNAPLDGWTYNVRTTVAQYLARTQPSKVILGVPYYGYKWSTTTNAPYAAVTSKPMGAPYAQILEDFTCARATRLWDLTAQSPWTWWWSPASGDPCGANHNSWRELYYDDAASLALKYDLVNANGLLGTGMWALGYDGNSRDLWQVLADKFRIAPRQGYWMAARDGGVFSFGNARFWGSAGSRRLNQPMVGMARTPDDGGYWLVAADGGVFTFGNARFLGSMGGRPLNRPAVGMAATPSGRGYWLVAADGGIFTFGDAGFYGSTGGLRLNQPVVGMSATTTGRGYWLVAADGGIFSFGDALFYGSTGALRLNQPVVGMNGTATGRGYWLVAADGGIFTFGDALFYGSTGALRLNQSVVGMSATASARGYWLVAADGGIFTFGDAGFYGSMGSTRLNQPVTGMGATRS